MQEKVQIGGAVLKADAPTHRSLDFRWKLQMTIGLDGDIHFFWYYILLYVPS
jgi:hypothetical protein